MLAHHWMGGGGGREGPSDSQQRGKPETLTAQASRGKSPRRRRSAGLFKATVNHEAPVRNICCLVLLRKIKWGHHELNKYLNVSSNILQRWNMYNSTELLIKVQIYSQFFNVVLQVGYKVEIVYE